MRIFLTGVACVGKSTIGPIIAELLGVKFFDLDVEVEAFFQTSIERLQGKFFNMHGYRIEAAKALTHLLNRPESMASVIALPPSGVPDKRNLFGRIILQKSRFSGATELFRLTRDGARGGRNVSRVFVFFLHLTLHLC